jgi:hypothetical protein
VRGAWALAPFALAACHSSQSTPLSHRATDVACPLGTPVDTTTSTGTCQTVADCPALPHVSCIPYDDAGASYCNVDACDVDTDCADGGVCQCATPATASSAGTPNVCLAPGNCRVDSDCHPVAYCSPSSVGCGTTFSYYCHTPGDDCDNDTDCRELQFCQYAPGAGKWTCVGGTACD